ncbi:MAG TPA: gliding motility-associated ABC transporter ATP-binding subunit GldA [Tenuifilaceae bacterium]|nr:gliding motility-associated ABC transporter ATP-binding subunit GldA [Tenuifilaceae bacterium]HPE18892.1 gliding motility-associated ABC transporter ATP-binding subunit GldA [Tenuifilaceae bacterium]HPJ45113.1 gliding motility-associated ABC transporter ATP-binding subunit GldA [Tenuifilaceae bacterium]HPQ33713.1 gliding motility-associated ABC transporter ATP-binding subunit GldA [Tenuifilaceae bacterium]HRX68066.1 gliding motility-associated ABC transporter ATP-binding subunit GldA [Tenuif
MSIIVKNITKLYGEQRALNDVSFTIPSGQVVGFLGPNGAGKSTMMKVITGYLQPNSGRVLVNGMPIDTENIDYRRNVGYLPEHNPLYLDMYVKEYLSFVAKVYDLGRLSNRRISELVELTGIRHEQNKKIGQLSRGYRQRVGLAQALLNRPSVLILDEPTSGLDPNQIVEIRKIIMDVGKEKTVMLSTHIMQEVEAICKRVIIIDRGKIVADDSTSQIMAYATGGNQSVLVEFIEDVDVEEIKSIEGVVDVTGVSEKSWLLNSQNSNDLRPSVFSFAVDKGYTIITMQQKARQMEDVFQQLTNSQS